MKNDAIIFRYCISFKNGNMIKTEKAIKTKLKVIIFSNNGGKGWRLKRKNVLKCNLFLIIYW